MAHIYRDSRYTAEQKRALFKAYLDKRRESNRQARIDDNRRQLLSELKQKHESTERLRELNERFDREREEWSRRQPAARPIVVGGDEKEEVILDEDLDRYGIQIDQQVYELIPSARIKELNRLLAHLRSLHRQLDYIKQSSLSESAKDIRSESIKNQIFELADQITYLYERIGSSTKTHKETVEFVFGLIGVWLIYNMYQSFEFRDALLFMLTANLIPSVVSGVDYLLEPSIRKAARIKQSEPTQILKQIVNITGEKDCPICFEEYNTTDHIRVYLKPCGHSFGERCIKTVMETEKRYSNNPRCPKCKATIESITDIPTKESIRFAGSF
jgi:Ring finger domain